MPTTRTQNHLASPLPLSLGPQSSSETPRQSDRQAGRQAECISPRLDCCSCRGPALFSTVTKKTTYTYTHQRKRPALGRNTGQRWSRMLPAEGATESLARGFKWIFFTMMGLTCAVFCVHDTQSQEVILGFSTEGATSVCTVVLKCFILLSPSVPFHKLACFLNKTNFLFVNWTMSCYSMWPRLPLGSLYFSVINLWKLSCSIRQV